MKRMSEGIKLSIKLVLGFLLIFFVLRGRMVDFQSLKTILFEPKHLLVTFSFLFFSALCCAVRWFLLIRAQGLTFSFREVFELTMIGSFFNTFMPGAVGGDLIKAWYMVGKESKRKTKAIFTVLLDRIIGLSVIIFYAAITLFFSREWLSQSQELHALAYSIWGFTVFSLIFVFFFYSPFFGKMAWFNQLIALGQRIRPISKMISAALLYREYFKTIVVAFLLSGASIFGINLIFSILGHDMGITMDLSHYFFVVPLGLTVSAVPILPGGIGVGQVAFYTLFQWVHYPNPEQGGALCTVMQIYTILFNCIGAVFYLKHKRRPVLPIDRVTIPEESYS